MRLVSLSLHNFRNYDHAEVEFSPGLNEFYGDNAQGKTNLLEAIYFVITGRSFRTARLTDLIREGAEGFHIEAAFIKHDLPQTLAVTYTPRERKIVHNATPYSSFANLLGLVQGVVFAPQDQGLITGAPAVRRRFLDLQLAQSDLLYVHHLDRYYRAMKQRNHLLRHKNMTTIELWEQEMARAATHLTERRQELVEALKPRITDRQTALSQGNDALSVSYHPKLHPLPESGLEEGYLEAFASHRERETIMGYTMIGPHRDDLHLSLQGQEARHFGSEGQLRCCAMSLRLAEWDQLYATSGEAPLKIVDDVGPNLDPHRRLALYHDLKGPGQTFLSAPTPLTDELTSEERRVFQVENGQITERLTADVP